MKQGHDGNHVVIEPKDGLLMEVLRDGSMQPSSLAPALRTFLLWAFPSKDFS